MENNAYSSPARATCPLCECPRLLPVLDQRPDYEYGTSPGLSYAACQNRACGLVFAVAIPSKEVIQSFYTSYSTHSEYRPPSAIASIIASFSARTRKSRLAALFKGADLGRLNVLDYGCGAGEFMRQLKGLGIGRVVGYDFDPLACKHVREQGLTAFESEREFQAAGPYDFIFLNHVIEHLSDPVADLANIARVLAPGGRLVIRTPNSASFLARLFESGWRGWETPRHLHICNTRSIRQLTARMDIPDLKVAEIATSNAMFIGMFHESFHASFWRTSRVGKLLRHLACATTLPVAWIANGLLRDVGEEVCMVIEKNASA